MKSTLCTTGKIVLVASFASILVITLLRKAIKRDKSSCPICQFKNKMKQHIQSS